MQTGKWRVERIVPNALAWDLGAAVPRQRACSRSEPRLRAGCLPTRRSVTAQRSVPTVNQAGREAAPVFSVIQGIFLSGLALGAGMGLLAVQS